MNIDEGDDSDEEAKGFVVASQYDPAPVCLLFGQTKCANLRPLRWLRRYINRSAMVMKLIYSLTRPNAINYPH